MWIAKIKYKHDDCVVMPKVVKNKVTAFATPGNSFSDGKFIYNTAFLMLSGVEKDKQNFIKDFRKDKNVSKVEVNKDLIVYVEKRLAEHAEYKAFRSKEIMCLKPVYCNPEDGYEYWEISSWDKKHITKFLNQIKRIGEAELLNIQQMKLKDVYHFHVSPRLTSKQKQALELAMTHGYYEVPRKTDLDKLAKIMKITRQAFSEHLRKAESKLMPYLTEDFLK